MTTATAPALSAQVRDTIEEILNERGFRSFNLDAEDKLEKLDAQVSAMLQDRSLGRILNGPLWLSGASVVDGTVTATKISVNTLEAIQTNTGSLNVTGNFTAAAAFPATGARVVINSSGLWGYSDATTTTFKLNVDGSGEIGTGSNKITWTSGGVLAVPAAVISSLTIADVGSGVIGSTFQTNAGSSRIDLSATGIIAYASGTETFRLNGTTGAMTATGSFTVKSAASGARVEISSAGGIAGYNSGGTQTFLLNAATGAGQLGTGSNTISWDSSGNASIGGVSLSSGKITASHISVTNLAAINANLGTITAGSINAASVSVTNLTASNVSSGALGSGGSGINLGGTNGLTINGTLTLGSGGKIIDADGSYWDQNGIVLVSSGTLGDSIKWTVSGTTKGGIYANSANFYMAYDGATGGFILLKSDSAQIGRFLGANLELDNSTGALCFVNARIETSGTYGITSAGTLTVGTGYTINLVSPGTGGSASYWSSFTTANIPDKSAGYFLLQIGGTNYRVPFYANG